MSSAWSPLTQGRELKFDLLRDKRGGMKVAPHTGA